MAYQFADTFCNVNSAALSPWTTTSGTITYSSAYARFAPPAGCVGGGIHLVPGAMRRNLSSNASTLIVFFSFGAVALPGSGMFGVLGMWDNGTGQTFLGLTSTGALQFYTQAPTFGAVNIGPASAPGLIAPLGGLTAPNHGIELQVTFANGTGSVGLWLDGTQVIPTTTGLVTIKTANAYANQVSLDPMTGVGYLTGTELYTDYVRVWDSTGTSQNAVVGKDLRPVTKLASAAGTFTGFTPVGLGSNYLCVQQNPPNAADYVSAGTAPVTDSYTMPVAGLLSAPSMVVARSYVEKDDAAVRTYSNGVLSGGIQSLGTALTLPSSYTWNDSCIPLDPATGLTWTAAGADAAQFLHQEVTGA